MSKPKEVYFLPLARLFLLISVGEIEHLMHENMVFLLMMEEDAFWITAQSL